MYVQCERCQTEYDFDDALVSEKGTTVKCTSCGHQFRVRRSPGAHEEDRWVITTGEGSTLVFTSLRELQRAIAGQIVSRDDVLARGSAPPRQLGSIAELEPFFAPKAPKVPPTTLVGTTTLAGTPAASPKSTLVGTGFTAADVVDPRTPAPDGVLPAAAAGIAQPAVVPSVALPPVAPMTAAGPAQEPSPPAPEAVPAGPHAVKAARAMWQTRAGIGPEAGVSADGALAPTVRVPAVTDERIRENMSAAPDLPAATEPSRVDPALAYAQARFPTPSSDIASSLPPPTAPVRRVEPYDGYDRDEEDDSDVRRRRPLSSMVEPLPSRGRGGWFLAVVALFGAGVVLVLFGRPYLERYIKPPPPAPPPVAEPDPRLGTYLKDGEGALDQGQLDAAKENFDKAAALAEKDPRVLVDLARLAVVRADISWLRQRLAAGDTRNADEAKVIQSELDERVAQVKKAADAAVAGAPNEAAAQRVKVEALRLSGEKDAARALVGSAALNATQPEAAYVLAALDLAEPDPPFSTVIERLRTAVAGTDSPSGRPRALLVYALARSGDGAGAKQELERLAALPRPHPLLAALRAYVEHGAAVADAGVAEGADAGGPGASTSGASSAGASPSGAASAAAPGARGKAGKEPAHAAPPPPANEGRAELQQADTAKNRNDLGRAKMLYQGVLARSPRNVEALTGLGDVARGQRDLTGAQGYYKRAVAENGSYMPALVGLADVEWEMGDRAGAVRTYKDIVERMPEGSYPHRVKQRIDSLSVPVPTQGSPNPEQP